MTDYTIPRSVGAIHVIPDMSEGPIPWWGASPGKQPLHQTFATMRDAGLTAVGGLLRAHPTISMYEPIRRAFRTTGIDVIVIAPMHWASTEWNYDKTIKNIRWQHIPPDIFELLYRHYGGQDKTIIVQTLELDWTVAGIGCRQRDRCLKWDGHYAEYLSAFEAGDQPCPMSWGQTDPHVLACDAVKMGRGARVLAELNELQAAAEAARAAHPNARLKVFFAPQVNFFRDEFFLVARDLIPRMDSPPDFVGLSLYRKAGDPVEAFEAVQRWTGLPPERIYIAEVGAKEGTQPDGEFIGGIPQHDRIKAVVNSLFVRGCPLAMVWSWAEIAGGGGHTGYAVIDAATGEKCSGYNAIKELNGMWRES